MREKVNFENKLENNVWVTVLTQIKYQKSALKGVCTFTYEIASLLSKSY